MNEPNPKQKNSPAKPVISFLQINVWTGLNYTNPRRPTPYETEVHKEQRYQTLLTQIREYEPDVIALNEANKLPRYAQRIAADLHYDCIYHVRLGGLRLGPVGIPWNLREGEVILAKPEYKLQFAGRVRLSGGISGNHFNFHLEDVSQMLAGRIEANGKPFYIFNSHWHNLIIHSKSNYEKLEEFQRDRKISEQQYRQTKRKLEKSLQRRLLETRRSLECIQRIAGDAPYIFMGDLNTVHDTPDAQLLRDAGLKDMLLLKNPGVDPIADLATWDYARNSNLQKYCDPEYDLQNADLMHTLDQYQCLFPIRIDFMFAASCLADANIRKVCLAFDEAVDGVHASDHFGLYSEVSLG